MPTRLGLGAPGRTDNAPPDQVYAGEGKRADGLVEENDCEQRTDDWHDVEVRTGCGRASCPLERKRAQLDAGRRFAGSRLHAGLQAVWRADSRVKEFDHFDVASELERVLSDNQAALDTLEATRLAPGNLITVRQQRPLGLGHAVWCARAMVGDEPFAVFLPDELMVGRPGCMAQMMEAYREVGGNLVSVIEVPRQDVSSYGVIAPGQRRGRLTAVTGLVEKPSIDAAPSNLIISGRYILQSDIMGVLEGQEQGRGGEIQLTDAMARMIGHQPFHAVTFDGRRFDCGSPAGFVEATLALALERPDMAGEVRAAARRLLAEADG